MARGNEQSSILCAALLALGLLANPAQSQTQSGETLVQPCLSCHGADTMAGGAAVYHVPMLQGQHADVIVRSLGEYKSGIRANITMREQAAALSDVQMRAIAAYLSTTRAGPAPTGAPPPIPGGVSRVCGGCHGLDGVGRMPEYPTLAGQSRDYLVQAMVEYRTGVRKNEAMAAFLSKMPMSEVEEVAAYFSKLPGLSRTRTPNAAPAP